MQPAPNPLLDHASYVALLDNAQDVHPLPHALYVSLARGESAAADFAGRTMTLADWYVRLRNGEPDVVVNETYTLITFDAQGRADWTSKVPVPHPQAVSGRADEQAWWPTQGQRDKMRAAVFAGELSRVLSQG